MLMRKPETELPGNWVLSLAMSAIGIDGLAVIIYMQDRAAAGICVSLLLGWQIATLIYFFRSFSPSYESLPPDRGDLRRLFGRVYWLAAVAQTMIAIAVWSTISLLAHGR
jgi:hypothetical protein